MPYITFGSLKKNDREETLNEYYGTSKAVIHKSRTLDEIFHGSTTETKKRDSDQVVTRWINRKRKEDKKDDGKKDDGKKNDEKKEGEKKENEKGEDESSDILRVDQLWLWVIDDSK